MIAASPTVVLADDHRVMRGAVAEVLGSSGFEVVGQADDAEGAIALVRRLRPDICVLDINMPGDGLVAAHAISGDYPDTTVVMLTVLVDDDHLFQAIRAGARGYLVKGTQPEVMTTALNDALRGEPALSPGLSMRILEMFAQADTRRVHVNDRGFVQLSPREAEVLDMLRQGLTTASIARHLSVSPVTVRSHVSSIMKKVRAGDRRELLDMLDH